MQASSCPDTQSISTGCCLTIGNFDGLHLGHRQLLESTARLAREQGLEPVVVTFSPHPRLVLTPERPFVPLTEPAQRKALLQAAGAERVLELKFTPDLARLDAQDFLLDTLGSLNVHRLVVGHDFRMGHNPQRGQLEQVADQLGLQLTRIPPVLLGGLPVSSTRIREALANGEVELAQELLGRPYAIRGMIRKGFGRGRKLGFPTANLEDILVLLPADGVYATWAEIDGKFIPAITNIGFNPTFSGQKRTVESFLLDTAGNLYDKAMTLHFISRMRGEKKFSSPEELAAQIATDVQQARATLQATPIHS